jgi:hypothetical protein
MLNLLQMTKRVTLSMTCDNKTIEGVVTISWPATCFIRSDVLVRLLLLVKEYTFLLCLCCSTICSGDPMEMDKMGGPQTG